MTDSSTALPTSSLPCPPWCDMPAGHGFDSIDGDGSLRRGHQRVIRDLRFSSEGESIPSLVSVWLSQSEQASSDEGPVLGWLPLEIVLDTNDMGLETSQARQVAAALLDAADAWDRAVSEEGPRL